MLPPQDHTSWKELVNSAGPDGTARTNLRDDVRHSNSCEGPKPLSFSYTCSSVASKAAIGFAIPKTKMPLQSRLPSWPLGAFRGQILKLSVCFLVSGLKAWLGTSLCCRIPKREPVLSHWRSSAFGGRWPCHWRFQDNKFVPPACWLELRGSAPQLWRVANSHSLRCVAVWCLTLEF